MLNKKVLGKLGRGVALNISDKDIEAIIQAKPGSVECALLSVKDALDKLYDAKDTSAVKAGKPIFSPGRGKGNNVKNPN